MCSILWELELEMEDSPASVLSENVFAAGKNSAEGLDQNISHAMAQL